MLRATFLLFITLIPVANGQSRYDRFAVILEDPPLAEQAFTARQEGRHLAEVDTLARIRSRQAEIGGILERRKVRVVGATQRFLNAVYVLAKGAEADQLRSLPGVRRAARRPAIWSLISPMGRIKRVSSILPKVPSPILMMSNSKSLRF